MERELGDVRDRAARLRLLPASSIFGALERAARDAAEALGRQVEVRLEGGDERVDGHVLTAARDALLHAVRNAVAHGIEPPEDRSRAGKSSTGALRVRVSRHEYSVRFSCVDDGRGIDVAAVSRAALRKGLVTPEEADDMAMEQAIRLVVAGRVTTAAQLTGVSGRGVGLDVVRETVARLKGDLHLESQPGRGTTVELRVPLSLSAMSVLAVQAGDMTLSLPLDSVVATLRVHAHDVVWSAEAASVVHDGLAIPFVQLARLMGLPAAPPRGACTAVVMRARDSRAALAVDRLIGPERVVIRRLPPLAGPLPLLSGASLEADGSPRFVLDAAALVEAARTTVLTRGGGPSERLAVLVVDDSLTTRMLEQSILETAGYEVELAESGEEGLETARRRRFGVMLVDIEMPGMDGFEFLDHCKKDPALRDVPAILVSSRSSREDRRRGQELGAIAYVDKSEFDQGRLLDMIRGLMS